MSNFSAVGYKLLKQAAKATNVVVFSTEFTEGDIPSGFNGVSIAFRPSIPNSNTCRMLDVAVSYCAPGDTYVRKHGKYQALLKMSSGEVIKLPLGEDLRDLGKAYIKEVLSSTFLF
jgi:hypothetical protein